MTIKYRKFSILAIILFGVGIFPLAIGFDNLSKIDDTEIIVEENLSRIHNPITITIEPKPTDPPTVSYVNVTFDTLEVFSGDTIGVNVTAHDVDDSVNYIYILFLTQNDEIELTAENIIHHLAAYKKSKKYIFLPSDSDPPFSNSTKLPFMIPNEENRILAVASTDNFLQFIGKPAFALTVHSTLEKIQLETNQLLNKQNIETQRASQELKNTNYVILGLTYIGIAALPMLAGTDIFLRIYLKD